MSTYAYREIIRHAQDLTPEEMVQLIEDLAGMLRKNSQEKPKPRHSIMELEGLGAELWRSIDVDQYIEEERNSWDG